MFYKYSAATFSALLGEKQFEEVSFSGLQGIQMRIESIEVREQDLLHLLDRISEGRSSLLAFRFSAINVETDSLLLRRVFDTIR
jgi:hypothetical protein